MIAPKSGAGGGDGCERGAEVELESWHVVRCPRRRLDRYVSEDRRVVVPGQLLHIRLKSGDEDVTEPQSAHSQRRHAPKVEAHLRDSIHKGDHIRGTRFERETGSSAMTGAGRTTSNVLCG